MSTEAASSVFSPSQPFAKVTLEPVLREVVVDDVQMQIPVLVIDSPEKWQEAAEIHGEFQVDGRIFPCRAMSLDDWEKMENDFVIREQLKKGESPEDFERERQFVIQKRRAFMLEVSTGKPIPGSDWNEKGLWVSQRTKGSVEALAHFITNEMAGFANGQLFQMMKNQKVTGEAKKIDSFDEWDIASSDSYCFMFHHPGQNFLCEIPIRGMSSDKIADIDRSFRMPDPPMTPLVENGRMVPGKEVPNPDDPKYKEKVRVIHQRRTVSIIAASLPFEIPGNDLLEQYKWLGKRCVGNVTALRDFIEEQVLSYGDRYNFFSRGLLRRS